MLLASKIGRKNRCVVVYKIAVPPSFLYEHRPKESLVKVFIELGPLFKKLPENTKTDLSSNGITIKHVGQNICVPSFTTAFVQMLF